MGKENALIVVEKLDITVVFSEDGMSKLLKEVETKAIAHVSDTNTEQGRKDIASLAYKVTRSKTLIDDLGKDVVSDWKKKAKQIDGYRKTARDFLDDLKNKVRQPLTDWEQEESKSKAEKERLEKEKIQKRVDDLFALDVVMSLFDVAMMPDEEYTAKYDLAKKEFDAAIAKAEEERIAKEAEKKKLVAERADIERTKKEQEDKAKAIKKKEKALEDEKKAIEDEKKKEQERKNREEFEKKVAEDAIKTARFESLQAIGFTYPFDDLGTMPDAHYAKMFEEHQKAWDKKQNEILLKKLEKERAEKEKKKKAKEEAEAAEQARILELAPDKEKLINYATAILDIPLPSIKSDEGNVVLGYAIKVIGVEANEIIKQAEELQCRQ